MKTRGLHHVTAIAGDAQKNVDFYAGELGMKLVKVTVNFDDPSTYHLYYGDEQGSPGTLLTFFAWSGPPSPTPGFPRTVAMSVPRPGAVKDPDGIELQLTPGESRLTGVTLATLRPESTKAVLEFLGFQADGDVLRTEESTIRVEGRTGRPGHGPGTMHHIAFRAADDAELVAWQEALQKQGLGVTEVIDRNYFHSLYFREPGGTLFEIATDPPGFGVPVTERELGYLAKLTPLRLPETAAERA